MKYRPDLPEQLFCGYSSEKQLHFLYLLLKEVEQSSEQHFALLRIDFVRLIEISDIVNLKKYSKEISQTESKESLIQIVFPYFQEKFYAEKDFHFLNKPEELIIKQSDSLDNKRLFPLTILLHNLRSAFNVGAIIRSAECFGVEKIIFSGYTPLPDHPKVIQTSMNTSTKINWEKCINLDQCLHEYRNQNYDIYALETAEPSVSLFTHSFKKKNLLIAGNEALGLDRAVLEKVDYILQIPLFGWKNSLNVGTATSIACYEIIRQVY